MHKTYWLIFSDNKKYPYQVVPSPRAKYIRVKLSNQGELSVVLPRGVAVKHAHEFLKSRRDWVAKHLQGLPEKKQKSRPETLHLALLDEIWSLHYSETNTPDVMLEQVSESRLSIVGNINDLLLVKEVILMWCKQKARSIFNTLLQESAEQYGFHYKRLSIRAQKTRWGSCSSSKNINLNCKLLFLPYDVVRYVVLHELCHTIEMNHSARFWALVEECDPFYQLHRKQLKQLSREAFSDSFWH
jgi:predicted metal-dependent hydrolase